MSTLEESGPAVTSAATSPIPDAEQERRNLADKTCFVVMPYGSPDKLHRETPRKTEKGHFDEVFRFLDDTTRSLGMKPLRSDRVPHSAPIHGAMISELLDADLVIVDITKLNANVFYELGVRHTARPNGTIIVAEAGSSIPFNIGGVRIIFYDFSTPEATGHSREALINAIHAHLEWRLTDSLVHSLVRGLNVSRRHTVLTEREERTAELNVTNKNGRLSKFEIGMITGDIASVDTVDVWVNPESTRMEMARVHDETVSAYIRFHGARRDHLDQVQSDLIHDALTKRFRKHKSTVEAGTVIVTGPGELKRLGVRHVFHVAAQHGEP